MKKNLLLFLTALCCAAALRAAPPMGIGTDLPDKACAAGEAGTAFDNHTRALEYYIAGLKQTDPAAKILCLLEAVRLDPQRRLPLLILCKALDRSPASVPTVKKTVDKLKKDWPDDVFIALQSVEIDLRAGVSLDVLLQNIRPVLSKTPPAADVKYFNKMSLKYIDLLLKTPAPTQVLPFADNTLELQECALLYYSTVVRRDRLSMRASAAAEKLKALKAEMRKAVLKNAAVLRRHLAVLSVSREKAFAFETARRSYLANGSPAGALLLAEAAAQAGEIGTLEEILKKYPAPPVDFCARMRLKCYQNRGEWARAKEELVNLKAAPEKLAQGFLLAQQMRDVGEMKTLLEQMVKDPRLNKLDAALKYLLLAETAADAAALQQARKLLGTSYLQNPGLANSVGYVSAVVGTALGEAEMLLEFALSKEPCNAAYLDSMAWIKHKRGDHAAAAEYIEKAFRYVDNTMGCAVMADHAGDIYRALGNMDKARRYYRLADDFYKEDKNKNADLDRTQLLQKIKKYCK